MPESSDLLVEDAAPPSPTAAPPLPSSTAVHDSGSYHSVDEATGVLFAVENRVSFLECLAVFLTFV